MKSLTTTVFVFILSFSLTGQKVIDQLFNEYKTIDNVTHIELSESLLKVSGANSKKALGRDFKGAELIMLDAENNICLDEFKSIVKNIRKHHDDEAIQFKDGKSRFSFFFNEEGPYISDLFMVGYTEDRSFLIRLDGKILRERLSEFNFGQDGFDYLKKLGGV